MIESFPTAREQVTSYDENGNPYFDRVKFLKYAEENRKRFQESIRKRRKTGKFDIGKVR